PSSGRLGGSPTPATRRRSRQPPSRFREARRRRRRSVSMVDNAVDWDRAAAECVEHLQALIRIPSVNPPGVSDGAAGRDSKGAETAAAAYCAEVLTSAGNAAQVLET